MLTLAAGPAVTLRLCDCCALAEVNGATSGHNFHCDGEPLPRSLLYAAGDRWHVAVSDDRDDFSTCGCDGCRQHLAGARTMATGWVL